MDTLADLAIALEVGGRPISMRAICNDLGSASLRQSFAAFGLREYYKKHVGILSVGSPVGGLVPTQDGFFRQDYTFGSLISTEGDPIVVRRFVAIELAAVRCFASDDVAGDETYIIANVYAIDPQQGAHNVATTQWGPAEENSIKAGTVFANGFQLANGFAIPGDGSIRVHVQMFDAEVGGDPDKVRRNSSTAVQGALATGLAAVGGPLGAAADVLGKATEALDMVGDAIGNVIADAVGDDLLGEIDFVIDKKYLTQLSANPDGMDKQSASIPGVTYNFPTTPEDDSWLFHTNGTYRAFFNVTVLAEK